MTLEYNNGKIIPRIFMSLLFKLATTEEDLKQIYKLRKAILVDEEGFIPSTIEVEQNPGYYHIIAIKNNHPVGVITVYIDQGRGVPIEEYAELQKYKQLGTAAEFCRLAVIPDERLTPTSLGLTALSYELAKKMGVKFIFIDLFKSKKEEILKYEKMGFKTLGSYIVYNSEVVVMVLDIEKDSIYEKLKGKIDFRNYFVHSLKLSPDLEKLLS